MRVLSTQVDTGSDIYIGNRAWFHAKLEELENALAQVNSAGGPKYVDATGDAVS